MSKPGEGASLTLGEAAAYARGRAAGLREAAGVANQHAAVGAGHYAGTAILALLDGAAAGDAQEADDGWDDEAGKRINSLITKLEAARARIAELERERDAMERRARAYEAGAAKMQAERDAARRAGAAAMREAAAKVCQRSGKHAAHNISTASEGMKMWFDGAMSGAAAIEENIRALPLPQEAGDE